MNKLNSTVKDKKMQEAIEQWSETIESQITVDLEKSAKDYGAYRRKRGIKSASELLKMLMIYATSKISIKLLALAAAALDVSIISDTAWQKRIKASVKWIAYLLNIVLLNIVKPIEDKVSKNRNVYLIDGSCFRQEGKENRIYRAHMSYCLNTGCMNEVKVTDVHTAESMSVYKIEQNAIYIADTGYGRATQIGHVISNKADVLFRITPNNITLYDEKGEKINAVSLLKTEESTVEVQCFVKYNKKLIPIRFIASRLPEDKIEEAIKRKKRKSQKNQSKIKPETLIYAEWVILVTSLDDSYTKEELLDIYRSRWQVELLFKRIKQNLKIDTIKAASPQYALAIIQLWLLVWAITEKHFFMFEKVLIQKNIDDLQRVSVWTLCKFFYTKTVSVIDSQWSLLVDVSNVELLAKFILNHKDSRKNQYYDFILSKLA